jgi:uncharacterized HAD superfamily protein
LADLSKKYHIIYIGARPMKAADSTRQWLEKQRFPKGDLYLAEDQSDRMQIVLEKLMNRNIVLGIGDRYDDNELHLALGCKSIILKEYEGNWSLVRKYFK